MKMKDLCKSTAVAAFLYDSNFKNHNIIIGFKTERPLGWNPKEHKRRLENFEEPYEPNEDIKRHAIMNNHQTLWLPNIGMAETPNFEHKLNMTQDFDKTLSKAVGRSANLVGGYVVMWWA